MARKPHDLSEWLQFLWLSKDSKLAEFAAELQENMDNQVEVDAYFSLSGRLEEITDNQFKHGKAPDHDALDWLAEQVETLDEQYQTRLERARKIAAMPKPMEYDL